MAYDHGPIDLGIRYDTDEIPMVGLPTTEQNLVMTSTNVPAGVDFVDYLNSQVAACDVFLAVKGRHWVDAKDDSGHRRFDNTNDYVTL
jgi:hypothetical protein